MKKEDSKAYLDKKARFEKIITIYGRNAVLEALEDKNAKALTLHLSKSNIDAQVLNKIKELATKQKAEIKMHDKAALSRISKNAKQDQGVALDIESPNYESALSYLDNLPMHAKIIALDGITNPQNLGMIIRSVAASKVNAIILPKKNAAKISPLVIKASAGTLFKAKILYCDSLEAILPKYQSLGFETIMLSSHTDQSLFELGRIPRSIYVLGNESDGVSKEVETICSKKVAIPMENGVESLNVAVTAALIAFAQP
jgi:23S rRNA (guanosine2251-2'-O)-methyltransferase